MVTLTQSPPPLRGCKSLYPNLSQYVANRAQTAQSEPNAVLSFQEFTSEPERNHPFAKPFTMYGGQRSPDVDPETSRRERREFETRDRVCDRQAF